MSENVIILSQLGKLSTDSCKTAFQGTNLTKIEIFFIFQG